jgi:hypothetical protein
LNFQAFLLARSRKRLISAKARMPRMGMAIGLLKRLEESLTHSELPIQRALLCVKAKISW